MKINKINFDFMSAKFFIRSLVLLVIISLILRLFGIAEISDMLLLGLMAHSCTLIGLNAWDKNRNGGSK